MQLASIKDNIKARLIAEEAVAMCPENPWSYNILGWVHYVDLLLGSSKSPMESFKKAMEMAQKALAMDDSIYGAHALLSNLYTYKREYDKGIAEGERAVALEPSGAYAHEFYANSLFWAGRPNEAIPIFQKAIRLNPFGSAGSFVMLGAAYRVTGRFEEAVSAYKKGLLRESELFGKGAHLGLAATYIALGREKEARAEAAEVLRINPKFSLDSYAKILPHKDRSETDRFIGALRKAGLN